MSLVKSTATIGGYTLLSRVLGFLRDVTIASSLGASMLSDAFFVAFKLPNVLRRLFAEGSFSQAFVPVLSDYQKNKSAEDTCAGARLKIEHRTAVDAPIEEFGSSGVLVVGH